MPFFFVVFVLVPLVEIGLFIQIGGRIGLATTLLIALGTAILGGALFRYQGVRTFQRAIESMNRAEFPVKELFDGFCLVIAAALLITPGFFTDTIGFVLLIPQMRDFFRSLARKHMGTRGEAPFSGSPFDIHRSYHSGPTGPSPGEPIEAEYEKIDERDPPGKGP